MYLKKIELFGFKSFAHKTEVLFEPGITCIVGPNGCGKSNVSDAIRWVLGERSAKLLRGAKMEDVIFSGTDFKKPVHFAEASLTIDNADQKLAIQYEEVEITRRLHRSGESEYLINKTPCRLKDVHDLILDTGLGSTDYSMIGQGRIDHILTAEPEERRHLIEEAAGISKYKVKKEEALRKLERTEQNLLRLNDILSEVERNIRYAERQAKRAESYKTQLETLRTLEIKKAVFDTAQIEIEIHKLQNESRSLEQKLEIDDRNAQTELASLKAVEQNIELAEQRYFEEESKRSEKKQKLASIQAFVQLNRERIESLKGSREKAIGIIETLQKKREELNKEFLKRKLEQKELAAQISEFDEQISEVQAELDAAPETPLISQKDLDILRENAFALARKISELRNASQKSQLQLASLTQAGIILAKNKIKLTEERASFEKRAKSVHGDHANIQNESASIEEMLIQIDSEFRQRQEKLREIETEESRLLEQKRHAENQYHILNELDEASGLDSETVKVHLEKNGDVHPLLDVIQVAKEFETALEAVLRDRLKALVAENQKAASDLLDYVRRSHHQNATILVADKMGNVEDDWEEKADHVLLQAPLYTLVKTSPHFEPVVRRLLSRVYLVEEVAEHNLEEILALSKTRTFVSKAGIVVDSAFQIRYRSASIGSERSSIMGRKNERERLRTDIDAMRLEEKRVGQEKTGLQQKLNELAAEKERLNSKIHDRLASLERIRGVGSGVEERMEQIEEELKLIRLEETAHQQELKLLEEGEAKTLALLQAAQKEEEQLQTNLNRMEEAFSANEESREALEEKLDQLEAQSDLLKARASDLSEAGQMLENQLTETSAQEVLLKGEREEALAKIERFNAELAGLERQEREIEEAIFQYSVQVEQLKRERITLLEKRAVENEKIQAGAKQIEECKQKKHELHLKEMEFQYQKNAVQQELTTRYQIQLSNLDAALYQLPAEEYPDTAAEIERLRVKMEAAGNVNLLAIDEYQELKERFDFLDTQRKDLVEARESLLEAIRKINRTTKKLFDDTLIKVRESFQEYFRLLFKGGQADLVLLDEINPLESGIDIMAKPPGKKLQHISLLSGGEKALTAIALLFALFSVRPSPFCVLDEVDAPLDEANTDRFLSVLEQFLSTTQFIIVTHSRKTIAMGNTLYGVTMEEPGISKLVSVRLAQDHSIEHENSEIKKQLNQILA